MKNINTKISRISTLALLLGVFLLPVNIVNADLDKNYRENFAKFTQQQCFNSISYSVDDITGFEKNEKNEWECQGGKCEEYQTLVNCLFDDAFQQSVNMINAEARDYANEELKELQDAEFNSNRDCAKFDLQIIQTKQEFNTDCSGENLSKFYSSCRVTETILNELCGYQNFLTAKSRDFKSFRNEKSNYQIGKTTQDTVFDEKSAKYIFEIEKSKKAFIETAELYKNFIHNYRIHAWLISIKTKLNHTKDVWNKIKNALETFPSKFIDATSLSA